MYEVIVGFTGSGEFLAVFASEVFLEDFAENVVVDADAVEDGVVDSGYV